MRRPKPTWGTDSPRRKGYHLAGRPFFDGGRPCLVAWPVYPGDDPDPHPERESSAIILRVLDLLIANDPSPAGIGRRALLLAYVLNLYGGPRTQRDLARHLELSPARVNKILRDFRGNLRNLAQKGEQAP